MFPKYALEVDNITRGHGSTIKLRIPDFLELWLYTTFQIPVSTKNI